MELQELIIIIGFILIFASALIAKGTFTGNLIDIFHEKKSIPETSKVFFLIGLLFLGSSFF